MKHCKLIACRHVGGRTFICDPRGNGLWIPRLRAPRYAGDFETEVVRSLCRRSWPQYDSYGIRFMLQQCVGDFFPSTSSGHSCAVHDCISLLLGSRERYDKEFSKVPATFYLSEGWTNKKVIPIPLIYEIVSAMEKIWQWSLIKCFMQLSTCSLYPYHGSGAGRYRLQ